jgi:hypothetical protein
VRCTIHNPFNALPLAEGIMNRPLLASLTLGAVLVSLAASSSDAQQRRRRDQDEAYAARQAGHIMPLNQIEARIVPKMAGADYLGPEFDATSGVYRLKFMRGGSVIWVDVDGRTGTIVGRSGY